MRAHGSDLWSPTESGSLLLCNWPTQPEVRLNKNWIASLRGQEHVFHSKHNSGEGKVVLCCKGQVLELFVNLQIMIFHQKEL